MEHEKLTELIYTEVQVIHRDLSKIKSEIAVLKVKSGIWGLIAGVIPVAIAFGLKMFS